MSRYTIYPKNHPKPEVKEVAYGYDRPLQEYFWQEFDAEEENVGWSRSHLTGMELYLYLSRNNIAVPEDHKTAMILDMPF